jgi:hypothetical protein
LSQSLSKRIEEAREDVERIQAEREEVKKWTDKIHLPLHQLPPANQVAEVDQYNKFHFLSSQLAVAQQVLSSLVLESLTESTNQLNSSVKILNESANAQLETTKNLLTSSNEEASRIAKVEKSSHRLEFLTGALLIATVALVYFSADSLFFQLYTAQNFQFGQALFWSTAGATLVGAMFLGAFYALIVTLKKKHDG